MRIIPLMTAILVSGFLYLLVFERDWLLAFASGEPSGASQQEDQPDVVTPTETAEAQAAIGRRVSVIVQHSEAQRIDSAVLARGRTEAARQVEVKSETSGLVISEPLRRGAYVTTGQALCQLDMGTRDASLKEAEARLLEAKGRLPESEARVVEAKARLTEALINERAAAKLSEDGFASETRVAATTAAVEAARAGVSSAESGVQAATSGIRSSEAAIEAVQKDIERLTMVAPFDGLLETDTAELGALLQPGASCAQVIQLDPIKLVGFLAEADVDKVSVGAMAQARLVSGREAIGRVTFLSRSADPQTRTFRVEVTVPNPDLNIRDGQTAELGIASEGRAAHLLPGSALTLNDEGKLGVRIVDADSHAQFMQITLLRDSAEGVWITGLPDVADVIVVGQEFVIDGVAVDAVERGTKP